VFSTGSCPAELLQLCWCLGDSHLWQKVLNMPKKKVNLSVEEKERIAAQLLAASEGIISTAEAMKIATLKTPERSEARKKKIYRRAKTMKVSGRDNGVITFGSSTTASTPRQLQMEADPTSQHSVSSLSAPPSNSTSASTNQGLVTAEQEGLRRQLANDSVSPSTNNPQPKKRRRSSQQTHLEQAEKNKKRKAHAEAVKTATTIISSKSLLSPSNPNKSKSQIQIVKDINTKLGTNISSKTVSKYVRLGKIGISPQKPGPAGQFNKTEYEACEI